MKKIIAFLKDFYKFLKDIHSSGVPESAKRFYGGIGFLCAIIIIWTHVTVKELNPLVETLLYVSAGLIGLGMIENIINKLKNKI